MTREELRAVIAAAIKNATSIGGAPNKPCVIGHLSAATAALSAIEAAGARVVNFAALAEDDAAVERVARALCVDDDVDPDAVGYDRTGRDLPNWYVVQGTACAAIRALGE